MSEAATISSLAPHNEPAFDVERVRADFPILSREIYGKPLVYLDNAASAQKPVQVLDAIRDAYANDYANVHRGLHYLANASTQAFEGAREKVRALLNAPTTDEIIFTKGGTEAMNLVAQGYLQPIIQPGDEIVISMMEHHSNIVPWHFLRERQGAVLKWVPVLDDGSLDMAAFEAALGPKTKLVSMTHMSNVLGSVVDAKKITDMAHAHGAAVLIDGCQGAVHMDVDVQAIGCDFYVMTGHKLYGPTGIGALYGRAELLAEMQPYQGGGEMIREVHMDEITYGDAPHKFEAGTPPIVQAIGLGAAIDYVNDVGRAAARAHEADLIAYATAQVQDLNWITIHGTMPGKGAIMSFSMEGAHPHDVATIIDRSGIAIRAGQHCAEPLMAHLGVPGTARASFAMYNTRADVDAFVVALEKAREFLG
ncbi:Cysteine desulfurase, SufS subfamily [Candidatus Phaeomarinobacter ectocarpi]|uniref:Cysteine desulfurase n=1 Tax=Candidatus Phaeomarinibacter ectocarpi TaxID=1458461 RepID=X5MH45_9HYPH|nr:cysteine desulfurase [Candidatus Phaeomarinobacter ectocarpi]CDO60934.1 Cysteine desulfurase, SufS subfamily [Candidatus Phaeomarinobacter ectocarpi]